MMHSGTAIGSAAASHLGADALFLVWGPPSHGPRSRVFARELGIEAHFLHVTRRRGLLAAPYKYASQTARTVSLLLRRRPRVVFVQSPPTLAAMVVWLWSVLAGARFVVDAHSAAMLSPIWTRPRFLYRALARRAVATIVTNEHFAEAIRRQGGTAIVIGDIPTTYPTSGTFPVADGFSVAVVSSFAPDEPLPAMIAAARQLDGVDLYVTGDPHRLGDRLPAGLPDNVHLTGFLTDVAYYALLRASDAVMCLTTRDHTMQRGACEALWIGRPIVTSRWPLLERSFGRGTVHVDNTAEGIRDGIREVANDHARYVREIRELQDLHRAEWGPAVESLRSLLDAGPARRPRHTKGTG